MGTPQTVIRNFMTSLNGTRLRGRAALDEAVRSTSNYGSWQDVLNSIYNDCRTMGADAFLKDRCGIILGGNNKDTGAISGSKAGGGEVKTAESIVPERTNEWRMPTSWQTRCSDYNLTVDWTNTNLNNAAQVQVVKGLYTWWMDEGLRLIDNSYGLSFNDTAATVNTITVKFEDDDPDNYLAKVNWHYNGAGKTDELTLLVNMRYYNSIDGNNVNGKSANTSFYLDRVIAHELVHATMAANITYVSDLPYYIREGASELVHGIDDERPGDIRRLASNPDQLKEVLNTDEKSGGDEYAGGYIALRYFAKQAAAGSSGPAPCHWTKVTANGNGNVWLSGYDVLAGRSFTHDPAFPDATELDGSSVTSEVILAGNSKNDLIKGGQGKTSLWGGGASNDTLQGGSGRDMFWFGAGDGNDVVTNYASGNDVINLYSGSLTSFGRNGNNLKLNMNDGSSLTVQSSPDAVVLYSTDAVHISGAKIGDSNKASVISYTEAASSYFGGSGRDTLQVSGGGNKNVWLDGSQGKSYASIEIIDGSESTGADQLVGSSAAESIQGGKGQASLWGGAGSANDTLRAGSGDTHLFYGYGEGNDVLQYTGTNDRVVLYNIGLDQLTGADIGSNDVKIRTTANHTLTVQGEAAFTLSDGSTWRADHNTKQWSAV